VTRDVSTPIGFLDGVTGLINAAMKKRVSQPPDTLPHVLRDAGVRGGKRSQTLRLIVASAAPRARRLSARRIRADETASMAAFFDRLVKRGYVHEIRCVHNRARVYHVHHTPLYFLIGEASSRYRGRCRRGSQSSA
jgi:hypothetical protein